MCKCFLSTIVQLITYKSNIFTTFFPQLQRLLHHHRVAETRDSWKSLTAWIRSLNTLNNTTLQRGHMKTQLTASLLEICSNVIMLCSFVVVFQSMYNTATGFTLRLWEDHSQFCETCRRLPLINIPRQLLPQRKTKLYIQVTDHTKMCTINITIRSQLIQ